MAKGDERVDYDLLRQLVEEAVERSGKSARKVSLAVSGGSNPDLVRNLLTGTNPKFGSVVSLCEELSLPLNRVLKGVAVASSQDDAWLVVRGEVKAGAFNMQPEWSPSEWYDVEVEQVAPHEHGLKVVGDSMNLIFPQGTILKVVDVMSSGLIAQDEDYVIVQRSAGDLVELTCKKLSRRSDGAWELIAESSNPRWQDPIYIGRPTKGGAWDFDAMDDDEVRMKAVVLDALLPLRRRRTRRHLVSA